MSASDQGGYCADEFNKYALANNKLSEHSMKASVLTHHPLPVFGEMRPDAIKTHAIEILNAETMALEWGDGELVAGRWSHLREVRRRSRFRSWSAMPFAYDDAPVRAPGAERALRSDRLLNSRRPAGSAAA